MHYIDITICIYIYIHFCDYLVSLTHSLFLYHCISKRDPTLLVFYYNSLQLLKNTKFGEIFNYFQFIFVLYLYCFCIIHRINETFILLLQKSCYYRNIHFVLATCIQYCCNLNFELFVYTIIIS